MSQGQEIALRIEKKFAGNDNGWQETSLEDCLAFTEESGFFEVGSVKEILEQGEEVETPYAIYRRKNGADGG